jgi:hypothetical protein
MLPHNNMKIGRKGMGTIMLIVIASIILCVSAISMILLFFPNFIEDLQNYIRSFFMPFFEWGT